ncbi:hypothetical protein B0T26DRAFT_805004 [Lasiosphaeria miniovina]|uniref:Uncharacterized protein n=1 Tax=Lasiosphaeria miniovina TaxID=1954250 RepID=A0AA40A4Z2_9PEZI|nr:uncharacterized protein B0T26DRAFT_805004 [Lasiosphaeria miniovina]KAK0709246.1 hypothetical protein B0T26DRAFT_805004 [Lasiosphaeria miniovina]
MGINHIVSLSTFLALFGGSHAANIGRQTGPGQLGQEFDLHAWGNGIPGLPVFYADANTLDNLVPVSFTIVPRTKGAVDKGYSFSAAPNRAARVTNSAAQAPPFNKATLFVGGRLASAQQHAVGFVADGARVPDDVRTGGFKLDARSFRVVEDSGLVHMSLYCAFPSAAIPGLWDLRWNVSNQTPETSSGVPVSLKATPYPANTPPSHNLDTVCLTMQ